MSESNSSNSSHPFVHMVGSGVTFTDKAKQELEVEWDRGIIVCAFASPRGVAVHVANPETGDVTPALTMESLKLDLETLQMLQAFNDFSSKMVQATLKQLGGMFE